MTTSTKLPFTIFYGEPTSGITEVLYELITNALDANAAAAPDTYPTVVVAHNTIVVTDLGTGITVDHLSTIGAVSERNESKHGSHGTGLKDAIACCVRKNINISIETVGRTFTFRESAGDRKVEVVEATTNRVNGTAIKVPVQNAADVFADVKRRFLFLMDPTPQVRESKNPAVDMYEAPDGKGAVMMMGVRKDYLFPLDFIYNFTAPTRAQKDSIARDQSIRKGYFKSHFRKAIEKANPDQKFSTPLPRPSATVKASAPISAVLPAPPAARSGCSSIRRRRCCPSSLQAAHCAR
jgi:hypothetical protein